MNAKVTAILPSAFPNAWDTIYREVDGLDNIVPGGIKKIRTSFLNLATVGTIFYNFERLFASEPPIMENVIAITYQLEIASASGGGNVSVLSRTIEASPSTPVLIQLWPFITFPFDASEANELAIEFIDFEENIEVIFSPGTLNPATIGLQGFKTFRIETNGKLHLQYQPEGEEEAPGSLILVAQIAAIQL